MYIIVAGDIASGFYFFGPFETFDEAETVAANFKEYNRIVLLRTLRESEATETMKSSPEPAA